MATLNRAPVTVGPHARTATGAATSRRATVVVSTPWTAALVAAAIGAGAAVGSAMALASTLTLNLPLG